MKAHRILTLVLVAALSACIGDNPTGVTHVEMINGVPVTRVADLGMFKFQGLLVADEVLQCEVMDFGEFSGGDLNPGPISILGESVTVAISNFVDNSLDCGTGDVLVFDTSVFGGEDSDLDTAGQSVTPPLGNVLTHQSCETDGVPGNDPNNDDSGDTTPIPNDADIESTMLFTFPGITGDWVVKNYTALDQEGLEGEFIALDADGSQVGITDITGGIDGGLEVVVMSAGGASFSSTLEFQFDGSGAIDDIEVCRMIERGGEGCTPGFWKQPQHFDSWPSGDTGIRFDQAFAVACASYDADLQKPESGKKLCDLTLLQALKLKGGGANALGRHAAAAWLNTQSVDFKYSELEVQTMVGAALMTGMYEPTKDGLDEANNAGCPLS